MFYLLTFCLFSGKRTTPKSLYKRENAINDGQKHLFEALNTATKNPFNSMSTVGKFIIYLAQAILLIPASVLQPLIMQVASDLYTCAGEKAATTPNEREKLWTRYHLYVIDSEEFLLRMWEELFNSLAIQRNTEAEAIFTQNILKNWYRSLLKDRNNVDFPAVHDNIVTDAITQKEQSIIRYVAGFVAYKLRKFYSKFPANRTAQHIVAIINDWKISKGGDVSNFLQYTTKWIDLVDRGGLYHVNDAVFCFFRQLEEKSRPYINTGYINQHHTVNLKEVLKSVLLDSPPIRVSWNNITRDFVEREILLRKVVDIFINIRIRAFVKALCYQNRQRLSKKRAKSLRSALASASN